jgi:hypothetical protein
MTGLRQRHGNGCNRPASGCRCQWEANVYIQAERPPVCVSRC